MKRVEMYYYPCIHKDGSSSIFRHWADIQKNRKALGIIDFTCCGSETAAKQWISYYQELLSRYDDNTYPVCYTSFKTVPSSSYAIYGYVITYRKETIKTDIYSEPYRSFAYPSEGYVKLMISIGEYILSSNFNRCICIVVKRHICHLLTEWSILNEAPVSYRDMVRNFKPYANLFSFRLKDTALNDPVFANLENVLTLKQVEIRGRYGV